LLVRTSLSATFPAKRSPRQTLRRSRLSSQTHAKGSTSSTSPMRKPRS